MPSDPGAISFGLVSIPIKLYAATASGSVSFNLLHAPCGSRIRQQQFCPQCNAVVERGELVRAYEFAKEQYVRVSDEELKTLEGEASKTIDIAEFVPLDKVDPIFFERTYYLGPDKGGEKPYRLLADAMAQSEQVAVARFVMRGKENIVLVRAAQGGLLLHTMYFADEVRNFGEIDKGQSAKIKENEIELALQLISGLASDDFKPEQYQDEYRQRVLDLIDEQSCRQGDHDHPHAHHQDLPGHRPGRGAPSEPRQARQETARQGQTGGRRGAPSGSGTQEGPGRPQVTGERFPPSFGAHELCLAVRVARP